ncbi:hypothetical protein [Shimia sp. SDUM112013]|uniref:hypothetical protein n=1 Tax=Shimia sp. SDUM112013 TaxID=3136160 RepID=UPI0032F085A4
MTFLARSVRGAAATTTLPLMACFASAEQLPAPASAQMVTTDQLFMMIFADQGGAVGFQRIMMAIHLKTVKSQLDRDAGILERNF